MRFYCKTLVYLVGSVLALSALIFLNASSFGQPVSYNKYSNETFGIEIEYPSDWEIDPRNYQENNTRYTSIVSFNSGFESYEDLWNDGISIEVDNIPYRADLNEYVDETVDAYKTYKNFHLVSSSTDASLAGLPAYKLTYTYTDEGFEEGDEDDTDLKSTEIGTIVEGDGIYVYLVATQDVYPAYLPIFNKMTETLKITGTNIPTDTGTGTGTPQVEDQGIGNAGDSNELQFSRPLTEFQGTSTPSAQGLISYENQFFGVRKIVYPEGWSLIENETSIQLTTPAKGTSPPALFVSIYSSENKTLEEFAAIAFENTTGLLESKPIKLEGNQPAHLQVFGFWDPETGVAYTDLTVLVVKNELLYVLDYFAEDEQYQKYLPSVIDIIKSLDLSSESEIQDNENISEPPAALSPL